jgi:Protein of unknown function (DUF3126)
VPPRFGQSSRCASIMISPGVAAWINKKGIPALDRQEIQKLQQFFRKRFKMPSIEVRVRPQKTDSAEVYIGDEFVGVVYRDDEDGDLSYNFTMAILDIDLD